MLEGNRALWQLSRKALTLPAVRQVITDCPPGEIIRALEGSGEGRGFLAGVRGWLNQYGQRLNAIFDLTKPGWAEDPTIAL